MNDQANGATYDNAGFQHEDGGPPPTAPQKGLYPSFPRATPSYVDVSPKTINTHTTVTGTLPNMGRKTGMKKCPWKYILCASLSVLLVLTVLGILLWHFCVFAVCDQSLLGKRCRSGGKFLSDSQWCNGVKDCPNGEDESQCFRLHGTNFTLEVYSSGSQKWLPVCAENWDNYDGREVCKRMGYKRRDYVSSQTSAGSSASKGYMKLKSGSYYGHIVSHFLYSKSCSVGAVTLQCVECGVSSAPPSARIVGGTPAANGAWPWQVSLQIDGQHVCGGSIINRDWILSAAHCFQKYSNPGVWMVRSGGVSLSRMSSSSGSSRTVNKIIRHGKYNTRTNDHDIALLKLNSPLGFTSTVKPVCLPNSDMDFSGERHAWITGWGALRSSGPSPDRLNQAQVTVYSRETCNSPEVLKGQITKSMICAGKLQGGVDTCQGDSGGPLVVEKGGLWWLAGDTSWGIGCAEINKPGVYGNVPYFIDWVYEQMQND